MRLPSSVRETPLRWHDFFVGREWKQVWGATPLCLFWTIWKERNRRSFPNEKLSIQRFKRLFLCNLLSWVVYSKRPNVLIWLHWLVGFVLREGVVFCCSFGFCFFRPFDDHCIRSMYFGALFLMFFIWYYRYLPIQKKTLVPLKTCERRETMFW